MGEGKVKGISEDGVGVQMVAQEGDKIGRMLISVGRVTDEDNAVLFNVDHELIKRLAKLDSLPENMIVQKRSLKRSRIEKEKGLYVYPMWIKREKDNGLGSVQEVKEEEEDDGFGPF